MLLALSEGRLGWGSPDFSLNRVTSALTPISSFETPPVTVIAKF